MFQLTVPQLDINNWLVTAFQYVWRFSLGGHNKEKYAKVLISSHIKAGGQIHFWRRLAFVDSLTQTHNRSYLDHIQNKIQGIQPALFQTLVLIDIDYFKDVNDQFGHPFGDKVLQHVANAVVHRVRKDDIVVRYGGDEFCVLLKGESHNCTDSIVERLRTHLQHITLTNDKLNVVVNISCSLGFSHLSQSRDFSNSLEQADQALYVNKRQKRLDSPKV